MNRISYENTILILMMMVVHQSLYQQCPCDGTSISEMHTEPAKWP